MTHPTSESVAADLSRPLLAAHGLTKSFGAARALDDVSFELARGEIHALIGENGAGKSTLIKILGGAVVPEAGRVTLDGAPLPIGDPRSVRRLGVSIVYQEFTLVPELTVAENVWLGREQGRPLLRRGSMIEATRALLAELGVKVDPMINVRELSVAQQQMVEITRALAVDARVLIMDEPSAALSEVEVQRLFAVLRRLRDRGLGIIYISHRLEEIATLADRITVLRDGRHVTTTPGRGAERATLIRWMVGRDVSEEFPQRTATLGRTVLAVRGLSCSPRFSQVSFSVRAGEIVGLAGLVGSGRTSVGLAIAGGLEASGHVELDGCAVRFRTPAHALAQGVAYVTEDRKGRGIFPDLGTNANITMAFLRQFAAGTGWLRVGRERAAAAEQARRFDVRASRLSQPASTLSGGNQQKMLLARYLLRPRRLLILDEPTRGVDVGARAEIYALVNRLTTDGCAVLMISSELPEVLGMSDRIVVLREGRTSGELSRHEATPERVMALAS